MFPHISKNQWSFSHEKRSTFAFNHPIVFPGDFPQFRQDTKVDNGRRCLSPWTARWSDGSHMTWTIQYHVDVYDEVPLYSILYTQKKPWFKQITWRQFDIGTGRWWQFVFNPELQKPAGFWSNHSDMGLISIQLRFEEHIGIERRKHDSQMENSNKRYFSISWELPPQTRIRVPKRKIFLLGPTKMNPLNTKVDPIRSY